MVKEIWQQATAQQEKEADEAEEEMTITIRDVEDGFVDAQADIETWKQEFLAEFYRPAMEGMIAGLVLSLPPEVREQLRLKLQEVGYGV